MRLRWVALLGVALTSVGCTEGLRGVPMEMPKATGRLVASASTTEREGLLVLWNGQTSGGGMRAKAWVAGSQEELEAVWSEAVHGKVRFVDFRKYVVFAEAFEGGVCNPKIVGIDAEHSGLLVLHYEGESESQTCIMVATRIARVVAVPRRILPTTVVFLDGFAFQVPDAPFE
ncbi:MAG TPA: hypothetical protein VF103_01265 [Polyangiaceae bacterium]